MAGAESNVLALQKSRQGGERLKELVANAPAARLAGLIDSPEEFERQAADLQPEIIFLEMNGKLNGIGELLQRLGRATPRSAVIALAEEKDPDTIIEAMRLGVREYLTEPAAAKSFNDAVLRLAHAASVSGQPVGKQVAVMGVKGGVGTSQIALNLAWAFTGASQGQVALVDLDLQAGDLAVLTDADPTRDMSDVAAGFDRMDRTMVQGLMTEITPEMSLLAAPVDPVAAEDVKSQHVSRGLDYLTDDYQYVVLDLPCRLDEIALMALDRSDIVVLVVEPTVVGLKAAQRFLDLSRRLGHNQEKIRVVVNRDLAKGCLPRAEVKRVLERSVDAFLPNDSKTIMEAANCGCPALRDWPRAKWSKAVAAMAAGLEPGQPKKSLFKKKKKKKGDAAK